MAYLPKTISILAAVLLCGTASAQAPAYIPVQGTLLDSEGIPIDSDVDISFSIYELASGGMPVWTETQYDVPVIDGLFTVYLGDYSQLDLGIFAEHGELYLAVAIGSGAEMKPRLQFGSTPFAAYAEHAGEATTIGGMTIADLAPSFEVGEGLSLEDGVLSVDEPEESSDYAAADHDHDDRYMPLITCPDGYVLTASDDGWDCASGEVAGYSAGDGLSLSETVFSADTDYLQRRVDPGCAEGYSIRVVNEDGTVVCQPHATYAADAGLSVEEDTVSIDTSYVQRRVDPGCSEGFSIREINEDGSVVCQPHATYATDAGLSVDDGTVSVDSSYVQRRVHPGCSEGYSMRVINENGSVVCDPHTTYTAGSGLSESDTVLSVDTSTIQRRVSEDCAVGYSIQRINQDGSVLCQPDTTYSAGDGLTLSGGAFHINAGQVQRRVDSACGEGLSIRQVNQDGTVVCENTTYTAGTGLSETDHDFSVDASYVQRRVGSECEEGSAIRRINQDGSVECHQTLPNCVLREGDSSSWGMFGDWSLDLEATLTCEPGEFIQAGGYASSTHFQGTGCAISESRPSAVNTWYLRAQRSHNETCQNASITPWAICCSF